MRACCQSCTTDIADDITLFYPFARLDPFSKFGKVHIGCGVHAVVFDCHVVSTTVGLIGFFHDNAIPDGMYFRACRGCIVYAMVSPVSFQYRVESVVGETRRDAGIF